MPALFPQCPHCGHPLADPLHREGGFVCRSCALRVTLTTAMPWVAAAPPRALATGRRVEIAPLWVALAGAISACYLLAWLALVRWDAMGAFSRGAWVLAFAASALAIAVGLARAAWSPRWTATRVTLPILAAFFVGSMIYLHARLFEPRGLSAILGVAGLALAAAICPTTRRTGI